MDKCKTNKILEIGCYEGLTSVFFADNFIDHKNSSLTCVDPFLQIDNNDHRLLLQNGEELNFDYNISNCRNTEKITIHKITSDKFFENITNTNTNTNTYNFVYIDGCRELDFIQRDMENTFKVLEKDGIMWMYDYGEYNEYNECNQIIEDFQEKYKGQYEIIHNEVQVAIRKI